MIRIIAGYFNISFNKVISMFVWLVANYYLTIYNEYGIRIKNVKSMICANKDKLDKN